MTGDIINDNISMADYMQRGGLVVKTKLKNVDRNDPLLSRMHGRLDWAR